MNGSEFSDFLTLAQPTQWDRLGARFSGEHARFDSGELLTIVAAAVLFVLAVVLLRRAAGRVPGRLAFVPNSPRRLFGELCRVHRLGFARRRLLKKLAISGGIRPAAGLFVDPRAFDEAARSPELATQRHEIELLRERLFGPRTP
jgi:hypothetical protein